MAHLVKIGNSQGIRIPKPLVEQAELEGKELKLQVVDKGLLITPRRAPREGWKASIKSTIAAHGGEPADTQWLDADLISGDDLAW